MNKEKLTIIEAFLIENNMNTSWNNITHQQGIFQDTVKVVPPYNPYDDKYTIAVGLNKVYGYTISKPYNFNYWMRRWEESYSSKDELIEILNKLKEPENCW